MEKEKKTEKKKVNTCKNKTSPQEEISLERKSRSKKLSWPVQEPQPSAWSVSWLPNGGRNSHITVHDSSYSVQCK